MLFDSHRAARVAALMDAAGYRRILDLPAVPAANACGLRYDVRVPVLPERTEWCLRSFGVRFDLVNHRWRRHWRRWYSLGWGVADQQEVAELLLAQAWPEDPTAWPSELAPVRALAHRYVVDVDPSGCVRVAAVLDPPDGSTGG